MIALTIVDIMYIISNFIGIMAIRRFICYFFNEEARSEVIEIAGYILYYIFLTVCCCMHVRMDFYMLGSLVFLLIFSANFRAKLRTKLFVAFYVFLLIQMTEIIFSIICRYTLTLISINAVYYSVWSLLLSRLIFYMLAQSIEMCIRDRVSERV